MGSKAAIKVGFTVIIAFTGLAIVAFFLSNMGSWFDSYRLRVSFADVQGIRTGADVRLAGVRIGFVEKVYLDPQGHRAVLTLLVRKEQMIPKGSRFTLTTGGIIGDLFVQVTPPPHRTVDGYLPQTGVTDLLGTDLASFDELREQASTLADRSALIVKNLQVATKRIAEVSTDPHVEHAMKATLDNVAATTANAAETSVAIRRMVDRQEPVITASLRNVDSASASLAGGLKEFKPLVKETRKLISDLRETTKFLTDTLKDADLASTLKETLDNVKAASLRLDAIASNADRLTKNLADISGDEQLRGDIKATVAQVKQVAEKANTMLGTFNERLDKIVPKGPLRVKAKPQIDAYQRLQGDSPFRADASVQFPRREGGFLLAGIRHLGEGNKLNLEVGTAPKGPVTLRYGFIASKLGAGLDYRIGQRDSILVDAFNPNHLQLNVYARHKIGDNISVNAGMEDVTRKGQATLGLSYYP